MDQSCFVQQRTLQPAWCSGRLDGDASSPPTSLGERYRNFHPLLLLSPAHTGFGRVELVVFVAFVVFVALFGVCEFLELVPVVCWMNLVWNLGLVDWAKAGQSGGL